VNGFIQRMSYDSVCSSTGLFLNSIPLYNLKCALSQGVKVMMKELLTIGEVAHYAGLQTSAIRYYESMGLLPPLKRVNGHRRYDASILKRLGLIQLVRDAGFGIREIQVLFSDMDTDAPTTSHWRILAAEKIAELDALIQRTQATKAWLQEALQKDCKGVDDCVTLSFKESGDGMNVTLSCLNPSTKSTSQMQKSIKLMTMPPPSNS
jgi:MerR family transcriptional regulator, redox-sensitive transcriptional activator SoxR